MRTTLVRSSVALGFFLATSMLSAGPVLDPATYASPSGAYRLHVDPKFSDGSGPALYEMTRDGEPVWSGERPFALWSAVVTDDGLVAGYAYRGGVMDGNHGRSHSDLAVAILGADGEVRLIDTPAEHDGPAPREWGGASPGVETLLLDSTGVRLVVQLDEPARDAWAKWWTYDLRAAKSSGDVVPESPTPSEHGFVNSLVVQTMPETPLVFVHWVVADFSDGDRRYAAVLGLLAPDGALVWRHDVQGEYDGLGEKWHWYYDLVGRGIVQARVAARRCEFVSYSRSARLIFEIDEDASAPHGWRVRELDPEAGVVPEAPAATAPQIESMTLESLGTIELRPREPARSPIRDIFSFAIDSKGNLGFARRGEAGGTVLVRVDPEGRLLGEHALDLPDAKDAGLPHVAATTPERWIVLRNGFQESECVVSAWWFDVTSGLCEPVPSFGSGLIESLAATDEGGFVTLIEDIVVCDRTGRPKERHDEQGSRRRSSFNAAAQLADGRIAAVATVAQAIELFDPDGRHLESISIARVIGNPANYPSGLTADSGGGLVLHDFQGNPSVYRIGADWKVRAAFTPYFADGRPFDIVGQIRCAPDGTLWVTDRHSLLRLDREGVVDRILGRTPGDDQLGDVATMAVGADGRIYAVDQRTVAVHVFGNDGAAIGIWKPDPRDIAPLQWARDVTVDGRGHVYVPTAGNQQGYGERARFVHFTEDGRQAGVESLGLDTITEKWLFHPRSRDRWVLGYEEVYLVDLGGMVARTIERRPGGDWLDTVDEAAVAPDGALAVIASAGFGSRVAAAVCVYGADGEPVRTLEVPEAPGASSLHAIAFNGNVVATTFGEGVLLLDVASGAARRAALPTLPAGEVWWSLYCASEGRELWARNSRSRTIHRYAYPQRIE